MQGMCHPMKNLHFQRCLRVLRHSCAPFRELDAQDIHRGVQAACLEAYKQGVSTHVTRQGWFDFTRMNEVLSVLGQSDRALLEMRYIQGLKAEEIAQSLGWKVSRVRVRLHRARKRIHSMHSVMPDA